jgi:hypothetical protein
MIRPLTTVLAVILVLTAGLPADEPKAKKDDWKPLFDGKSLAGWTAADYTGGAKVHVQDGAIVMDRGVPMTGVTYTRGDFPKTDYEVGFEGKRVDGGDFFCTTTFPVGDTFCSLVVGGWGGMVVGLSSVDHQDASENETTGSKEFEKDKWYKVRIRVTKDRIQAWIDADRVVDLDTTDKKITIRSECEKCKPFGFVTWKTTGAVRAVRVRPLTDAEKKEKKDGG